VKGRVVLLEHEGVFGRIEAEAVAVDARRAFHGVASHVEERATVRRPGDLLRSALDSLGQALAGGEIRHHDRVVLVTRRVEREGHVGVVGAYDV
jgi:hypothetical protein